MGTVVLQGLHSVLFAPNAPVHRVNRAPAATDEGAGTVVTLNFGGLPYAIYVEDNATLTLNNTFLTGIPYASSYLNNTLDSRYGEYALPGLALFPSIAPQPGANVRFRNLGHDTCSERSAPAARASPVCVNLWPHGCRRRLAVRS